MTRISLALAVACSRFALCAPLGGCPLRTSNRLVLLSLASPLVSPLVSVLVSVLLRQASTWTAARNSKSKRPAALQWLRGRDRAPRAARNRRSVQTRRRRLEHHWSCFWSCSPYLPPRTGLSSSSSLSSMPSSLGAPRACESDAPARPPMKPTPGNSSAAPNRCVSRSHSAGRRGSRMCRSGRGAQMVSSAATRGCRSCECCLSWRRRTMRSPPTLPAGPCPWGTCCRNTRR